MPRPSLALRPRSSYGKSGRSPLVVSVICLSVLLIAALIRSYPAKSASVVNRTPPLARFSDAVTIKATNRDNPTLLLNDGHDVLTAYSGAGDLITALEQNQAQPLSLASADFDEDGVPDLVSGYSYDGRGIISVMRGNVDAIYPNAPQAQQRRASGTFTDAPFLSPASVFAAPIAADFIGAGDFDGDSHWDVVIGSRHATSLCQLSGDGRGNFKLSRTIELPGQLTALTTGEINRPDGLTDIVIGVSGAAGSQAMVFEGPGGALNMTMPEVIATRAPISALALDRVDNRPEKDLLIGAGRELLLVHGRDRMLSMSDDARRQVSPPPIDIRVMAHNIVSLTTGDFRGDQSCQIAMLYDDGELVNVTINGTSPAEKIIFAPAKNYHSISKAFDRATKLLPIRLSATPGDSLLVISASKITPVTSSAWTDDHKTQTDSLSNSGEFTVVGGPLAAILPMRLDRDAFPDLVVLRNNSSPAIMMSTSAKGKNNVATPTAPYSLTGAGAQDQSLSNGKIVFASNRDNGGGTHTSDIYVMNPDGGGQTRLTFGITGGISPPAPVWSPDGTKIAVSVFPSSGHYEIYVMNADGSGQTNLTNTSADEFSPSWSNDGGKLLYDRDQNIWIMNSDGSQQTLLLTNGNSARWSPTAGKILFRRTIFGFSSDIFVMNADGSGVTNLTNNPSSYSSANWSPDGLRIVYENNDQILTMNADGSGSTLIIGNGSAPVWSPDGSKLAFSRFQNGNPDIFVANIDGSNQTPLTNNTAIDDNPSWQSSFVPTPTPTSTPSPTPTPTPSASPPANDNFANAATLAPGFFLGTNVGATKEPGEPNHAGVAGGASVWYRWQAPAVGTATFYLSFSAGVFTVYTGSTLNSLTPIASNGGSNGRATFAVTAGTTYQFAVDGVGGATDSFFYALDATFPEADAAIFNNSSQIFLPDNATPPGKATTYPSTISVQGMSGTVTRMTLTLNTFTHDTPADCDILLVGPQGQSAIIMSDVGGDNAVVRKSITLDDFANTSLPTDGRIGEGTYRPTNNGSGDVFPSPAPPPSGSSLAAFNGSNPNGTWQLFVVDDNGNGKGGSIENGWTLTIDTGPIVSGNLVVTNTNDSGAGSLRQAIIKANGNPGADTIVFSIGSGPQTINLMAELPMITEAVTIDATTQPGFGGTPIIQISSGALDTLRIRTGNSVVRGFKMNGLTIAGPGGNNIVEGNYLSGGGVEIDGSPGNRIGGTTAAARNVIATDSSDIYFGAEITIWSSSQSVGNQIAGNFIGTNLAGTAAPANGESRLYGIQLFGGLNTTIGGTTAGARNVISDGGISSIFFLGSNATEPQGGNLVQGNYIGVDITGTHALSNLSGGGVEISGQSDNGAPRVTGNTVGGTVAAAANIISGHTRFPTTSGLGISGNFTTANLVQGNFIGTDATGKTAVANGDGIQLVSQQPGTVVGGNTSSAANVISGNLHNGISLGRFEQPGQAAIIGGTGATIQGNFIGTDPTGLICVPNGNEGIYVEVTTVIHTIKDNTIACNGNNGINIPNLSANPGTSGTPAFRINIDTNFVYSNHLLGIDLAAAGVSANDPLDTDAGANLQQNFPVLTSAVPSSASETVWERAGEVGREMPDPVPAAALTINGTLNSTPNQTFTVHWYFSGPAQCASNQANNRPLVTGKVPGVTTNGNGDAQFSFPFDFPAGVNAGIINCTATDAQGNTSEFSACMTVSSPTPTPSAPMIFVEAGTNNLAALDSVSFVRGPFALTNTHNYSSDQRTRIIFFTTDLGFTQSTQPDVNTLSVQLGGNSYLVESVGPNSTISGSAIVFRLPDLSAGTYPLGIRLRGVNSTNTPNLQIVSSPSSPAVAPKSNKAQLLKYLLFSFSDFLFS